MFKLEQFAWFERKVDSAQCETESVSGKNEYQLNRSLEIAVRCVIGQFCRQFPQLEDKSIINGFGKCAEA